MKLKKKNKHQMKSLFRRIIFIQFLAWAGFLTGDLIAQDLILADIPFMEQGQQLAFPFTGGMSSPQFSEIDLNGDGEEDLFVFDRVGAAVSTYVYDVNSDTYYNYAPEYISQFPKLNDWAFIRDYNGDGIPDIFTSDNLPTYFGVQIYQGTLIDGELTFKLVQLNQGPVNIIYFENENFNSEQLEVLPADLPAIVDADGDGDLDILDYDGGGGFVEFIKNMSVERGFGLDSLVYKRADRCWGKFFESGSSDAQISLSTDPNNCFTNIIGEDPILLRHVGSSVSVFDFDSDNLLDVLIGDISNDNLIFMKNTGLIDNAYMSEIDNNFPSYSAPVDLFTFPAAYFIDVNHDGLKDLIASPNETLRTENQRMNFLYLNEGSADNTRFIKQSEDFLVREMIDVTSASRPALVDYNADGLLDIVIGTYGAFNDEGIQFGQLFLYENTGTIDLPKYTLVTDDYLNFKQFGEMNFYLTPTFGDLDGDGDSDMLMGNLIGRLIYFENTAGAGNPFVFGPPQFNFQNIDIGNHANPAIVDIDQDGLEDLVIGEEAGNNNPDNSGKCSHLSFFKNIGSIGNPVFNSDVNADVNDACFGFVRLDDPLSDRKGYGSPQFLEIDDELVLITGSKFGEIKIYDNIRADINDSFNLAYENFGGLDLGDRTHPILDDLDNDDKLELIIGNLKGGLQIYHTGLNLNQIISSSTELSLLDFGIQPNPAHDYIRITGEFDRDIYYQIYNIDGKILKSDFLNDTQQINVTNLPNGMYTIQVKTENSIGVEKFVKM